MKKILLIILLILFLMPGLVAAAGLVPCGGPNEPACTLCHFFVMLDRVLDLLLIKIVPILAALMIAIGGFMYMVAHLSGPEMLTGGQKGGPKLLSQAKRLFTAVVIGLIIIYGAWVFVNLFLSMIGVADWTGLKDGWWIINCP